MTQGVCISHVVDAPFQISQRCDPLAACLLASCLPKTSEDLTTYQIPDTDTTIFEAVAYFAPSLRNMQ